MSIAKLKLATLVGRKSEKSGTLETLQELGCLHLLSLNKGNTARSKASTDLLPLKERNLIDQGNRALRYLRSAPQTRRQVKQQADFDLERIVDQVLSNAQRRRDINDQIDYLRDKHKLLMPWGQFKLPPIDQLGGNRFWFYILPRRDEKALCRLSLPWHIVHTDPSRYWLVIISPEEPPPNLLPVPRTHLGERSLRDIERRLEKLEATLDEVELEWIYLTRWITLLEYYLACLEDRAELLNADSKALEVAPLFVIQGWVPETDQHLLKKHAAETHQALLLEKPPADHAPPTLMRPPRWAAAGADLVTFYKTPAYDEWDPSLTVLLSFSAFFGIMVGDAGYASLLILLLGVFWTRMGKNASFKAFRPLLLFGTFCTLVWGILIGSYFGAPPPSDSLLSAFQVLDIKNYTAAMRLCLVIGLFHIGFAQLVQIAIQWPRLEIFIPLGWLLVLLGGVAVWKAPDNSLLYWVLFAAGTLSVALGAGRHSVYSIKDLPVRMILGTLHLFQSTKLFGDLLSYLRLFALGLATASLAITFNELAREALDKPTGLSMLSAILILLIGHSLNLCLGIISGVVHGLRLNYIEFFNWGLMGEGYPFNHFKKKVKHHA
ncbi:MAG: V-type ATPase 116kDa subunit family protein [Methylohalobius crimeensis]